MATQHITDYKKLPLEILFDLINHEHGTNLSTVQVTIDTPEIVVDNKSSIVVRAVPQSGYSGQQTLQYNRVPLSALTALEAEQTIAVADVTTYQEILDKFNAKYGVNITPDDVIIDGVESNLAITDYEQPEGPVVDILVKAKAGSYVWHGETTFKLRSTVMLLSDVLPIIDLNGLWLPHPEFADLPEGRFVATVGGDGGEVRVTDEGHVRVFEL